MSNNPAPASPSAPLPNEQGARYFCHVNGFQDNTAYVVVDSEGWIYCMTRGGNLWRYTAGKLHEFEARVARGIWRELSADEALALLKPKSWAVTVERDGESVVTLSSNGMGGRDLSPGDEDVIRTAAQQLLSFVGDYSVRSSQGSEPPQETTK